MPATATAAPPRDPISAQYGFTAACFRYFHIFPYIPGYSRITLS